MSITEAERHQLYIRLEQILGPDEATSLMEHLPPVGWADVATKRDLDHLGSELRGEMHALRADFFRELHRQTYSVIGSLTAIIGIALVIAHFA